MNDQFTRLLKSRQFWIFLSATLLLAVGTQALEDSTGEGQQLELLYRGQASSFEVRAEWASLRQILTLGPAEVLNPRYIRYPQLQVVDDELRVPLVSMEAALASLPLQSPGNFVAAPEDSRLVLIHNPRTERIEFHPASWESDTKDGTILRKEEVPWPPEAEWQRSEIPPKESYFFTVKDRPFEADPWKRQRAGLGIARVDARGKVAFAAAGDPDEGLILEKGCELLVGRDSEGRIWLWFQTTEYS